ncbi:hypothetical protein NQ317_001452 [Molorchus minor]|uniref:PDZ domain-containing protein n=1 Tax=Molorchus minor TaxID=1323400 RepID=A0ABQ9JLA6_9CUCU|nr:hypothetical protein NQ317_001452 [Molorchus minor]
MHPNRRRKKRPNYGIRTVEVVRGPNGFGFTISGQQPCILSCIVSNSPADQAGLRAGDFLISVNGVSVSKMAHDAVVGLIGNCIGPIKMTIAENYYSDSSDEELDSGRIMNSRKPRYIYKLRSRMQKSDLRRTAVETNEKKVMKMRECIAKQVTIESRLNANVFNEEPVDDNLNISNPLPMEDEAGPIEYKALVGYLGTIEMPKQLLPNSRLQTVCSCIRKLRQEKRTPTAVLMTVLPTCLTLKNASNHILAIYPTNRVVYVGSTTDRDSRYFGLVTSAVCDTRNNESLEKRYGETWQHDEKKFNNVDNGIEISNSCHVFVTDPKIVDHNVHQKKAESFKIICTRDPIIGSCLEFPRNALYIVSLIQSMYKLQNNDGRNNNDNLGPLIANSPQPSASSNSDSGIVEFPLHRPLPFLNITNSNRPTGIDASDIPLEELDLPLNNDQPQSFELNNVRCQNNLILDRQNNLSIHDNDTAKQLNNLNNIRACETVNIKNHIEKSEDLTQTDYLVKQNNDIEQCADYNRLTCRALPVVFKNDQLTYLILAPEKKSHECVSLHSATDDPDFKSSVDNISMHSSKSMEFSNLINAFKAPFESRKVKRHLKMVSSCDNLDKYNENMMNYKLSPKVYGLSKPNYSCEVLNNLESVEKHGYGSLQELYSWNDQCQSRRTIAQSEPDVRIQRNEVNNLVPIDGYRYVTREWFHIASSTTFLHSSLVNGCLLRVLPPLALRAKLNKYDL